VGLLDDDAPLDTKATWEAVFSAEANLDAALDEDELDAELEEGASPRDTITTDDDKSVNTIELAPLFVEIDMLCVLYGACVTDDRWYAKV